MRGGRARRPSAGLGRSSADTSPSGCPLPGASCVMRSRATFAGASALVEPSGEIVREKAIYVVLYEIDPATGKGYVYLPGGGKDDWAAVNTGTIYRGVEGNWFHATREWDSVAGPLITR